MATGNSSFGCGFERYAPLGLRVSSGNPIGLLFFPLAPLTQRMTSAQEAPKPRRWAIRSWANSGSRRRPNPIKPPACGWTASMSATLRN